MNKSEFLDKFYTGYGAKQKDIEKNEQNKARPVHMRNIGSKRSIGRVMTEEFRDQHKKLFARESEKKIKKPDAIKSTLFEKFREDYSDPFESAKESGATVGQIKLINFSMFALG